MNNLRLLFRKLKLQNFNVIIAFSGWPDANQVATYSAKYIIDNLKMEKIKEIPLDGFYNFSLNRPVVNIEQGVIKEYKPPKNELYKLNNDLLVLVGEEPHTNWFTYVDAFLQILSKANQICLLGSLIDKIPHTVETLISGVATTTKLINKMKENGIQPVNYVGPSSIHSLFLHECAKRDILALSIWAHTQEYINGVDFKAAHKLLKVVNNMLNLNIDFSKVKIEENKLQKWLNEMMNKDKSFSEFINQLESEYKFSREKPGYIM
ncbi:MAG: PAC2 family protein [Candidatus Bathyarchaeia archaeon]